MAAIRDVARRAGVSVASVSRVINGSPLVNEPVRLRVLQAMADLEYFPSAPARSLKGGRTKLLGVLLPELANPFYGELADGIEEVAYEAGYCVILCNSHPHTCDGHPHSRSTEYLRILREHRVAGLIITAGLWDNGSSNFRAPVVSVDHRLPGIDSVMLDNVSAGRLATEHLIALGHQRIAMVSGLLGTTSGRGRLVGYRRAMRDAGLPLDPTLQAGSPYTEDDARRLANRILMVQDRPTALVAATNQLTLGAIAAAADQGLSIPDDLALVGFDELGWTPSLISPLTTVKQPTRALGAEACRLVLERLNGYAGPVRRVYLPATLAIRLSCRAPLEAREPSTMPFRLAFERMARAAPAMTPV
ncbi:MAG TPA: LacI family DNA-binding transcriptional regulator [Chloroflexota bacterium]|nr:LacI family DNA-binding transcriptional regulator [Chloroflexota bacterium]